MQGPRAIYGKEAKAEQKKKKKSEQVVQWPRKLLQQAI